MQNRSSRLSRPLIALATACLACAPVFAEPTAMPAPTATMTASPLAAVPAASGSAYVTSLPAGADLWLDGAHIGRTPMLLAGLYPGRHTVSVLRSGFAAQEVAFRVVAHTTALENLYLPRISGAKDEGSGTLVFHVAPGVASLRLDGKPVADPARALTVPSGGHVVDAIADGKPFSVSIEVVAEMTTDVVLRHAPVKAHASVVAAVDSLLPADAVTIERTKIVIRYHGHLAVGHVGDDTMRIDGQATNVDPAPVMLGGRLYLPEEILSELTGRP